MFGQKFKVGQLVRVVRTRTHPALIGEVGLIIGMKRPRWNKFEKRIWIAYRMELKGHGYNVEEVCLAAIPGDDYQRFMERVMQPVKLGKPVKA